MFVPRVCLHECAKNASCYLPMAYTHRWECGMQGGRTNTVERNDWKCAYAYRYGIVWCTLDVSDTSGTIFALQYFFGRRCVQEQRRIDISQINLHMATRAFQKNWWIGQRQSESNLVLIYISMSCVRFHIGNRTKYSVNSIETFCYFRLTPMRRNFYINSIFVCNVFDSDVLYIYIYWLPKIDSMQLIVIVLLAKYNISLNLNIIQLWIVHINSQFHCLYIFNSNI